MSSDVPEEFASQDITTPQETADVMAEGISFVAIAALQDCAAAAAEKGRLGAQLYEQKWTGGWRLNHRARTMQYQLQNGMRAIFLRAGAFAVAAAAAGHRPKARVTGGSCRRCYGLHARAFRARLRLHAFT